MNRSRGARGGARIDELPRFCNSEGYPGVRLATGVTIDTAVAVERDAATNGVAFGRAMSPAQAWMATVAGGYDEISIFGTQCIPWE